MKQIMTAVALMPTLAFATTWYVNGTTGSDSNAGTSASSAKATIQAAIDVATEGSTILVAAGTYAPIVTENKRINIVSAEGADKTIIDGGSSSRCVTVSTASNYEISLWHTNTYIKGFALINGYVALASHLDWGGGIVGGTIECCIIKNCNAPNGGGCGLSQVRNCLLIGNYAINGGGANASKLQGCTVVDNKVRDNGSAGFDVAVINCIVHENRGYTSFFWWDKDCTAADQCVEQCLKNNYTDDPKFVDAANGDYRLAADSPCIDAGDNSYAVGDVDLDGNVRVANGKVDIGCYEYGSYKAHYNVTFDIGANGVYAGGGELTQSVVSGEAAVAPVVNSYVFAGWDKAFDNVTGDMTVTARYVETNAVIEVTNYVTRVVETTNVVNETKYETVYTTNVVTETKYETVTTYETNTVDFVVTNMVTNVVNETKYETVYTTNVVTETKYETVTTYETVVLTNWVDVVNGDSGVVADEIQNFEPKGGLDGTAKLTMNGIAFDEDGKLCGLAQISTAKATKKGVKVSGFVMADDGKKYTLKAATSPIVDGFVTVSTTAGKLGAIEVVVGDDGFRGTIANGMTIVSAETDDTTVILSGTLKLSYFNDKNKLATKNLTVGGTAAEGVASGTVGAKNQPAKSFVAEIE